MPRWPISEMSWPICRPQSPRCTSLTTVQPLARKSRCRQSPMIGGAQMTDMHRLGDVGAAEIDDDASCPCRFPARRAARPSTSATPRAASASSVTSRLMKPGPAISTLAKSGSAFSRAAIFSAMARGLALASFAAASAPLHWNCARSGRSERVHLAERRRQALRPRTQRPRSRSARRRARSWREASHLLVVVELRLRQLQADQQAVVVRLLAVVEADVNGRGMSAVNVVARLAWPEGERCRENLLADDRRRVPRHRHVVGNGIFAAVAGRRARGAEA